MKPQADICTETMARVYAQQGLWSQAAEIYRRLVRREPRRQDLAEALAEAEKKAAAGRIDPAARLVPLFQQWLKLLLEYEKIERLKHLQKSQ